MKKAIVAGLLLMSGVQAGIYESNKGLVLSYDKLVYDDFNLGLNTPEWQPRVYYKGVFSSSIGYFYVNSWGGDIGIYGSNRYVEKNDVDAFYESLQPLEEYLFPYATPNGESFRDFKILDVEDSTISGMPAKKVTFELNFPNSSNDEIVISYIFTGEKQGWFSSSILGYTYSISCYKSEFEERTTQLELLAKALKMQP